MIHTPNRRNGVHESNSSSNSNSRSSGKKSPSLTSKFAIAIPAFLFGCILSTMMVLNYVTIENHHDSHSPYSQLNFGGDNSNANANANSNANDNTILTNEGDQPLSNSDSSRRVVELEVSHLRKEPLSVVASPMDPIGPIPATSAATQHPTVNRRWGTKKKTTTRNFSQPKQHPRRRHKPNLTARIDKKTPTS